MEIYTYVVPQPAHVSLPCKFVLVTMEEKARNWSHEEVAALVDRVLENKEVIQSRHKDADTNLKKKIEFGT